MVADSGADVGDRRFPWCLPNLTFSDGTPVPSKQRMQQTNTNLELVSSDGMPVLPGTWGLRPDGRLGSATRSRFNFARRAGGQTCQHVGSATRRTAGICDPTDSWRLQPDGQLEAATRRTAGVSERIRFWICLVGRDASPVQTNAASNKHESSTCLVRRCAGPARHVGSATRRTTGICDPTDDWVLQIVSHVGYVRREDETFGELL